MTQLPTYQESGLFVYKKAKAHLCLLYEHLISKDH